MTKIKELDLSTGRLTSYSLPPQVQWDYLGGLGLGARLMADADLSLPALDPNLPLIVATGSLTATSFPGANRTCFFGVSPLTGLCAGSWLGGNFGPALARSDTLALVLRDRAAKPSVVYVDEERIEVRPRPDLWGLTVLQTRAALQEEERGDLRAAVIGPAGERLVPMANVRGDESHSAGRCGMGAVLGSKNVKAIVVHGTAQVPVVDPEGLKAVTREALRAIRESSFLMDVQGPISTPSLVAPVNEFHAFPTGNHRERHFAGAANLYGERIADEFVFKRTTCPSCPVRCRLHVRVDGLELEAAEYETVWAFGGDNCVDDYGLIARANDLCNDLGVDTISSGNTVAFYREYTDTLHDPSNILDLVKKIGYRQDEGDLLGQGTRAAARSLGVEYAMQVKGLELAAYDPRKFTGMAISYSTANRGGCHSRAWTVGDELSGTDFTGAELAQMVANYHDAGCVRDSLIVCTFLAGTLQPFYARALSAVLGHSFDDGELATAGERIYTLERLLNVRRGVNASQDTLPQRILDGMLCPETYREGMAVYYRIRAWDDQGRPRPEKLAQLGLDGIAQPV